MNSVGEGKVFEGKSILEITKETYHDRNINFRKFAKGLMLGMLAHKEYKTLNLECKTYQIKLRLEIVPGKIVTPEELAKKKKELADRKIELAKKKIIEVKKKIVVV